MHPPPPNTSPLPPHPALPTPHNAPGTRLSSRASVLNGELCRFPRCVNLIAAASSAFSVWWRRAARTRRTRSEEHTSELQSRLHLVCRLLLEKKNRREPQ